jgi:molybdopterin biosynthesis enzyme MoaB
VRGGSVIINLPGSATGSLESLQALFPGLLHIFSMMAGEGHGPADAKEGGKG